MCCCMQAADGIGEWSGLKTAQRNSAGHSGTHTNDVWVLRRACTVRIILTVPMLHYARAGRGAKHYVDAAVNNPATHGLSIAFTKP